MAMTIDEALEKLRDPTVTELDLLDCGFGEAEAKQIADVLPHSQVTCLNLGENNIGDVGATAIASALPHSQVTVLYSYTNNIGAAGATALADALPHSQVTSLDLSVNNIGDAGATTLAHALPHSQLTALDLSENNIGEAGATAIANALPHSQLTALDLYCNNIGDAGATAIARALPHSQVTSLDLSGNTIGDAGKEECNTKRAENAILAKVLAQKLVEETKLGQQDRIALQRLAHAVAESLSKDHELDEVAIKSLLLGAAEQLLADGAPQTKAFALRALPLPEAREWLVDKDIEVTLADFLTPEGAIPQGRFLCRGGIPALFLEKDLWETKDQFSKALRRLPPEQKAFIPNAHTLLANLSKRATGKQGQEM